MSLRSEGVCTKPPPNDFFVFLCYGCKHMFFCVFRTSMMFLDIYCQVFFCFKSIFHFRDHCFTTQSFSNMTFNYEGFMKDYQDYLAQTSKSRIFCYHKETAISRLEVAQRCFIHHEKV